MAIAEAHGLTVEKHRVPEAVFTGAEDMQRGFLQALFTADGSVQGNFEKGGSVRLAANSLTLLQGVQQVLLNFGIASRIYQNRRAAGYRMMPDANREPKSYWCEAQHELAITKRNMLTFGEAIGFLTERKQERLSEFANGSKRGLYAEYFVARVESVEADGVEDVYDLNEPLTHSFIANGIVVHNCGEQGLPAWGVCNLGAINLAKFYDAAKHDVQWEELGQTVRYSVRFLDNVIDATPYFFDENRDQQGRERRVGLNTMGVAELMIRLGIRYGSDESVAWLDKLYEFIATHSYEASIGIAKEKGAFPAFDATQFNQSGFMQSMPAKIREEVAKHGIRNVTLLTQAPNGTIGTMVDTSTGIEPFFSWTYYRKSRLGLHEQNVPLAEEWLQAHPGQPLPDFFVTAMQLTPEEHVRVQAAIQRWVDSSISKTCNVPNNYSVEDVRKLYEFMYDSGCKGGTIYRDGSRDEQVLMLKEEKKESKAEAKKAEAPTAPKKPAPAVAPLPMQRRGITISKHTPLGTVHTTSNHDENGEPFEVFTTIGKAGSDLQADAEAMGRLISLLLRIDSPVSRRERLGLIVSQLEGIGGARSVGFGINRVASMPDALAATLREMYFNENVQPVVVPSAPEATAVHTNGHTANGNGKHAIEPTRVKLPGADLCPECGMVTLVRSEGCKKCETCGYSEC
jgi:ribonucleoside-diphosphate reductase alpha chain